MFEFDGDLRDAFWETLAGAEVKRNSGPTPVVDLHLHRNIRLTARVGSDPVFVQISRDLLAADFSGGVLAGDCPLTDRRAIGRERLQDFQLLVADGIGVQFDDLRRQHLEVRVANPGGTRAEVGQMRPALPLPPVGKDGQVQVDEAAALGATGLDRGSLVLHGFFVQALEAPEDQRDMRLGTKIRGLAGSAERVEHDLEVVRYGNADDRALGVAVGVGSAFDGIAPSSHHGKQPVACQRHTT